MDTLEKYKLTFALKERYRLYTYKLIYSNKRVFDLRYLRYETLYNSNAYRIILLHNHLINCSMDLAPMTSRQTIVLVVFF